MPLDPVMATMGEDLKKFFQFVQDTLLSSDDKKVYALWHNTDTPLYYYNKEKIPTPPAKWTEVMQVCKDVRTKEGGKKFAFRAPDNGWIQMNSGLYLALGGEYLDKTGKPVAFEGKNNAIWNEMFAYYDKLLKDDLIPPGAVNQDQTQMMPDIYAGNVYSFAANSNFHVASSNPICRPPNTPSGRPFPCPILTMQVRASIRPAAG